MKGVALINAAAIIVFTDNFKRFSFNSRKICTYWGVTPFRNESGDSIRRGTHTSSFHNNWLKAILSEAVLCAIRYNERLKTYFLRLLAKGKHRNIALNNTKNKLLKPWLQWYETVKLMMRITYRFLRPVQFNNYIY